MIETQMREPTMQFWHVSYMMSQNDNGHCVTFFTEAEARQCAAETWDAGAWDVVVWSS